MSQHHIPADRTSAVGQTIPASWTGAVTDLPDGTIHALFEAQVSARPAAVALVSGDEVLSYAELDARANRLAHRLIRSGTRPGALVGICVERSVDLIVATLAVLKAGAGCVPLDPAFPALRLRLLLAESGAGQVLTRDEWAEIFEGRAGRILLDSADSTDYPATPPGVPVTADDVACVMFTSGSTGRPKGVVSTHRSTLWTFVGQTYLDLGPDLVVLQCAPISWDVFAQETWPALLNGGKCVLAPPDATDLQVVSELVARHEVTVLYLSAGLFDVAVDEHLEMFEGLRQIIVGGDVASPSHFYALVRHYPGLRVTNGYGPVEAMVFATAYDVTVDDLDRHVVPIGRVLSNTTVAVLDTALNPVPEGGVGELYLGGDRIALGYLGQPGTTAERFIPDPFGEPGGRLHRTGDFARWTAEGLLEFVGRRDDQVKLRGFRVEPGEVTVAVEAHPAVRRAIVVVVRTAVPSARLVAYVVAEPGSDGASLTEDDLLTWCGERLAAHLVPSAVVLMDSLPLTAAGKVDRAALPTPPRDTGAEGPGTPVERALAEIWAEVLGLGRVGPHDDFFRLGGDSILIMRVAARARRRGIRLYPRWFFTHSTIAELASLVDTESGQEPRAGDEPGDEPGSVLPLTPIQRWFFADRWRDPHGFHQSVLVTPDEAVDVEALRKALLGLVEHHDALRLRFWKDVDGQWCQQVVAAQEILDVSLAVADLAGLGPIEAGFVVRDRVEAAERALRVDQPPLLRAVLLDQGPSGRELLLIAHHLAVDTVSWGILLEDLLALYDAAVTGEPAQLTRTTSFAQWARRLADGTESAQPPSHDPVQERDPQATTRAVQFRLDAAPTARLVTAASGSVQELLLSGLSEALTALGGPAERAVDLEQHGRDHAFDDIDLLHTVGWFTRLVRIVLPAADEPAAHLSGLRRRLRADPGLPEAWERAPISVNYLGRVGAGTGTEVRWSWQPRIAGNFSPGEAPSHPLEVVARIVDGELVVDLRYDTAVHETDSVVRLSAEYQRAMNRFVAEDDLAAADALEVPLTPVQIGMVFPTLRGRPGTYVEQQNWKVPEAEVQEVVRAWRVLFDRHEALRTGVRWRKRDQPGQFVADKVEVPFATVDLSTADDPAQAFADHLRADRAAGFDLESPPLARLTEVRIGSDDTRLVLTWHHVLIDGWSYGLLLEELATVLAGNEATLPEAPPFRTYVDWLHSQPVEPSLAYWRTHLAGVRPELLARPAALSAATAGYHEYLLPLGRDESRQVREAAREHGLTLSSVVHGCWAIALSTHTGRSEVVFGSTAAVRPDDLPGVERMVGPMINTSVVRTRVDPAAPTAQWLGRLQSQLLDIRDLVPVPLGVVSAAAGLASGTVLCDTSIAFENYPLDDRFRGAGEGVNHLPRTVLPAISQPDFALNLIVKPAGEEIGLKFVYDAASVADDVVRMLADLLAQLLSEVGRDARRPIGAVPLLSAQAAARMSAVEPGPVADVPAASVVELFAARVAERPNAIALVFRAGVLSYAELDQRANRLAHRLRALGVRQDAVVGVCLERSPDLVVAVLAILKAGGAFLPLDPATPAARLSWLVTDAAAAVVVTTSATGVDLADGVEVVLLDRDQDLIASGPVAPPASLPGRDDLAYVIYTSGSTGSPKGVQVQHEGLVNRLTWMARECGLGPDDVVLQKTAFGFDVAVWELFWPLVFGARLHVTEPLTERDPARLTRAIEESGCTVLHFVPSALDAFLHAGSASFGSPRLLVCSGEALPAALTETARTRFPRAHHYNLYGPTEATIDVTYWRVPEAGTDLVPIGKPITNHRTYVTDRCGRQVPDGMTGELMIEGVGVARGYVGSAALTAERFVPNPFGPPGSRLYRTGDLVRRSGDGEIEYLGRTDRQVKIRGFRVECAEVEAAVTALDDVGTTAVVTPVGPSDVRRLVAFVTPAAGRTVADLVVTRLREELSALVPDHLVPTTFVPVASLPLKANGKVDFDALTVPDEQPRAKSSTTPPRTPHEMSLAAIWEKVLGRLDIDVDDDFFDLGGHSLAAMRIAGMAGREFGVDVPASAAFDRPTVAGMAAMIAELTASDRPVVVGDDVVVPASYAQQGMWLLDQMTPGNPFYNVPKAFRLRGELDTGALWRALNGLVARHEALRTRFVAVDGQPTQVVEPVVGLGLTAEDVTDADPFEQAKLLAQEEALRPFDLSRAPLLRCRLLRLAPDDHVLVVVNHHIVSDAWSKAVMYRDLWVLYRSAVLAEEPDLPELPLRYRDFTVWQRDRVEGEQGREHLRYWLDQMAGAPAELVLPAARPASGTPSRRGDEVDQKIGAEVVAALDGLAKDRSATVFMTLLAAFQALLATWSDSDEVVVGTPVAGRSMPELDGVIGMFVNMVPIRTDCTGDPSFTELVGRVRRTAVAAYQHQDLPFEHLVRELAPDRTTSGNPLVQVLFQEIASSGAVAEAPAVDGLSVESFEVFLPTSRFDIVVDVRRTPDGAMLARFTYAVDVLDREAVSGFAAAWRLLLENAARTPSAPMSELCAAPAALLRRTPANHPVEPESQNTAPDPSLSGDSMAEQEIEAELAAIWKVLLKVDRVGPDDDFFRLGGHSLLAARLCARLQAQFGVQVPMSEVFAHPRLRQLTAVVAAWRGPSGPAGPPPIRPRNR